MCGTQEKKDKECRTETSGWQTLMFSLTNTLLQDTFSVCTTGGSDAPKHMDDATSTPIPYCTDKYLSLKKYLFDFCMIFSP